MEKVMVIHGLGRTRLGDAGGSGATGPIVAPDDGVRGPAPSIFDPVVQLAYDTWSVPVGPFVALMTVGAVVGTIAGFALSRRRKGSLNGLGRKRSRRR
jgi:hypothetical protein